MKRALEVTAVVTEAEITKRLVALYGWDAGTTSYFVNGVAGPMETSSYIHVDGICNLAQESGMCVHGGGGVVLDAGCGTGITTILARQRGIDIIGIDLSLARLKLARQLGRIVGLTEEELSSALILGDVADLSYPDDYFSMVVCHQVIEHVDDPAGTLRELVRCLKPGGFLCLDAPDYRFPFEPHYKIPWIPFMEKEVAAIAWLEGFEKPIGGLSTFSYTTLPQIMEILAVLDVEVLRASTTTSDAKIEEQRRLLVGSDVKDEHLRCASKVRGLAMRARQNNIQTLETSFVVTVRKA